MAQAITDNGEIRDTLSNTPGNCTRYDLPVWTRRFTVVAETADVKFSRSGTDGAALGTNYTLLGAGEAESRIIQPPQDRATKNSVYVASTTALAVVTIICEPA